MKMNNFLIAAVVLIVVVAGAMVFMNQQPAQQSTSLSQDMDSFEQEIDALSTDVEVDNYSDMVPEDSF